MLKRVLILAAIFCFLVSGTGCSPSGEITSESGYVSPPVREASEAVEAPSQPGGDSSENSGGDEADALVTSVKNMIQQYKDGTVDTENGPPGASGPAFNVMPEDLEFPEIESRDDFSSVKPIKGHEETFIVELKCSGNYVMNMRADSADSYRIKSVIFLG